MNFTAVPAASPLTPQGERYAARIASWSAEALLDSLMYMTRTLPEPRWNEEDHEQVRVVRAEIMRRMA
jgi:hypothetical protein